MEIFIDKIQCCQFMTQKINDKWWIIDPSGVYSGLQV